MPAETVAKRRSGGQSEQPNSFEDALKPRLGRNAHGSIRIHEGQPPVLHSTWHACSPDAGKR